MTKVVTHRYRLLILALLLSFIWACGSGYGIYHRVADGETLDSISSAYGVSKAKLARLNNMDISAELKEGDAVYVPGASRRADTGTSAQPLTKSAEKKESASKAAEKKETPVITKKVSPPAAKKYESGSKKLVFVWPLKGRIIAGYGSGNGEVHDGIDIEAAEGTPISASSSGRVIYSGNEIKGYGNMVIVKHSGTYSTVYAHNSENTVRKGVFVKAGDVIALAGRSGRLDVPALHFEIRSGKKAVDPVGLLP